MSSAGGSGKLGSFFVKRLLLFTMSYIPIAYTVQSTVLTVANIEGTSMLPTIAPSDMVVIRKAFYKPQRGDIVVMKDPRRAEGAVLKRLTALGGDMIALEESEPDSPTASSQYTPRSHFLLNEAFVQIPTGFCWVEGDNGESSIDSRHFGPVPVGLVVGKASFVIWPFSKIRKLQSLPPPADYYYHTPQYNVYITEDAL